MKPALKICAELRDRDLYDLCETVARQHGVKLADVCSSSREPEIVHARHAVWHKLYLWFSGNASAVARVFGTDSSTVRQALLDEPPLIISVILAKFETDEHAIDLVWFSGRVNPFGVTDRKQDAVTAWFTTYEQAHAVFAECCDQAGAVSFRTVSNGAVPVPQLEGVR
jgi:hypothetical protein